SVRSTAFQSCWLTGSGPCNTTHWLITFLTAIKTGRTPLANFCLAGDRGPSVRLQCWPSARASWFLPFLSLPWLCWFIGYFECGDKLRRRQPPLTMSWSAPHCPGCCCPLSLADRTSFTSCTSCSFLHWCWAGWSRGETFPDGCSGK